MSNATPPSDGQTPPPGGQNPGQTPPTSGQTPTTPPPSNPDDQPMSVAEARRLRDELKQRRETQAAAEAELKKLKDAQLTEEQRKEQRLQELEAGSSTFDQERQAWRMKEAVLLAAPGAGIDAALALKLIDLAEVKTDAKGKPTNIAELLAQAIKDFNLKPAGQAGQRPGTPTQPNLGASNPGRSASSGEDISWDYIGRLLSTGDSVAYEARRAEIQAFMRKNPQRR